jgi:L-threonylcarbamoyladenylate synthase
VLPISPDAPEPELVERAAALLRAGKLVAIPTETVYGLGCNALDAAAVQRVFEAKERPSSDPLIAHVDGPTMLASVAAEPVPDAARVLMDAFWPGPLTVVIPRHPDLPDAVTSGLPDVAVRSPAHPVASAIISAAGVPIAAPSANRFSRVSPTSAAHVLTDLADRIEMVVDSGRSVHGLESTVVAFDDDGAVVLRHGAIPLEAIQALVPARMLGGDADADRAKASPGHDERHYSPRTATVAVAPGTLEGASVDDLAELASVGICYAGYSNRSPELPAGWAFESLGSLDRIETVAHDLYDALRRMDQPEVKLIVLELTGADGLGRAIDDRLTRAASSVVVNSVAELANRLR